MITVRNVDQKEFLDIHGFVSNCKPLESYPEHFYKIMLRYFGNSCFVAEIDKAIVGFVLGVVSQTDDKTYFLWQIGIRPDRQGCGTGKKFLVLIEEIIRNLGCVRIEVTVDPVNKMSQKLFEKMDYKNISNREGRTVKVNSIEAVKDYYRPKRHFILYEKIF